MDTREVLIPFSGFYCSIHDSNLDWMVDNMVSDCHGDVISRELRDRISSAIDWSEVWEDYTKFYCQVFEDETQIPLAAPKLYSPKYYNFQTDRIIAHIPFTSLQAMRVDVNETKFRELCRRWFTSCDGFSSHYPNNPDSWGSFNEWDHNQYGALLAAFVDAETVERIEFRTLEDYAGNRCLSSFIKGEKSRLLDLAYYLYKRSERRNAA